MYKIESYITSIILANADRYIRNFRKEDAQVSLWGGDATFHNIDLNVDALNEEFNSLFVFTSGYIRDLTIHVPWTKLMSEPVTISVNTIECVMRLKTKDEKNSPAKKRTSESPTSEFPHDRKTSDEITTSASYSSTLTTKIMNNLAIRCENIILKLVEEDIVFSMNIEKLSFENVNEQWVQAITDINTEKLLTRKLLTLSGVTICLDKQNSSGRIETYLEPLLYRCLIHIRLLRGYNRTLSKKPIYTHMDILSDKMSFTICEPQLPMLFKLGETLFCCNGGDGSSDRETACSDDSFALNIDSNADLEKFDDGLDETWGNWLWNMMPSILAQDSEKGDLYKEELNPTFNIGFCVKQLEINLKVFNYSIKKKSKKDFKNFLKSNFCGCFCQSIIKNNEWLNVQMGVSHAYVEICDEVNSENQSIQIFTAGVANTNGFMEDTLFNEKFDFFALKMHQKLTNDRSDDVTAEISEAFKYSRYDFMYSIDFSIDTHLNLCTENCLLEKTPAFAIDYVNTSQKSEPVVINAMEYGDENFENRSVTSDSSQTDGEAGQVLRKFTNSITLLRFVFGSSVVKINPDAITRVTHLYKILSCNSDFVNYQQSAPSVSEKKITRSRTNRTTQFTFFDFFVELHPSPPPNFLMSSPTMKEHKFFDIPETYSFCQVTPVLSFYCKCVDGSIKYNKITSTSSMNDIAKITSLKAVDVSCSTLLASQKYTLFACGKFDLELMRTVDDVSSESKLEAKNISFTASKPNLLLSRNIVQYLACFIWQTEAKQNYYTNIFCTSLLDDLLLPNHTVLETTVENISILYREIKDVYQMKLSINQCKAFASKVDEDGQKRVMIFSTVTGENGRESSLEMMLQRCKNCNKDCDYPSCLSFSFRNVKIYLDFIIYQWLLYTPISSVKQKSHSKLSKSTKDTSVSKSVPSRKISDTSSGSHSRKYSTAYPKPRESVHSSSEPEVHSPMEVTETDTSDLFHTADNIPIETEPVTFIQRLADDVKNWSCLLIFGEVSEINVYLPTIQSVYGKECSDFDLFMCQSLQNNAGSESLFGIFQFYLKSVKLKCDVLSGVSELLNSSSFVTVSKNGGSANKLTFPWTVSVADVSVYTLLENNMNRVLLKPLFMNSTFGVTFREGNHGETVINLCVHLDFQPVVVCLDTKQACLITNICAALSNICLVYERNAATSSIGEKSISPSILENSGTDCRKKRNRLTGWIQWTFTKCSVEFYNIVNTECTRILVQIEDSIISLEFDDIFHKLKTKVASFGMYHQSRNSESETWQNGSHYGVILQRCYRQLAGSGKVEEDDSEDRFLLVTVTRARSSNLRARLCTIPDSSVSSYSESFVTEIVVKLSPLDVILPPAVFEKFLAVVKPFIHFCRAPRPAVTTQTENSRVDSEMPIAYLPLVYFDVPMLRIFVPITVAPVENEISTSCDTLVCEVGSIHAHCHPENPVVRKPLNPDVYYSIAGTKYAPIEQKLKGQQYQLHITDVSVNTGMWSEIEQMLIKEQISVENPPSILEQNPAVMWNQGCHPDSKNRVDLKYLSPIISKFSISILVAPPLEYNFVNAAVYGAYFEVDVVTEMNVFLSLHQIPFFVSLCQEYIEYINPYFLPPEKEIADSTAILLLSNIIPTRFIDSGIESMEQSSVGSSSFSKVKNRAHLPVLRELSSKTAGPNILSNLNQLPATTFKKDNFRKVYITAQSLCFTVYASSEEKNEDGASRRVNRALLRSEITQPHFLISDENNSFAIRVGGFSSTIYVPGVLYRSQSFPEIPEEKKFYSKFLCIRALRCERYSRIKSEGYSFKAVRSVNQKWKIDCAIDQPIFIDCEVSVMKHLLSIAGECSQEYQKSYFTPPSDSTNEPTTPENRDKTDFLTKIRGYFNSISGVQVRTNRIVSIFKSKNADRGLFLNADSTKIEAWSPNNIKNSVETVKIQCEVNAIIISLPNIRNRPFWSSVLSYNQFTALGFEKDEILSTLILKPWNLKVDYALIWQRWNWCKENPWKRIKLNFDSVHFHLNPSYMNTFLDIASNYSAFITELSPSGDGEADAKPSVNNEIVSEFYKDDLRAGAFQYINREHDDRDLSAYEVVFCGRQIQPYMCWKYPQPRKLTKLQIYPVPVEDTADDYLERCLRCQLQYFSETTDSFHQYASFSLSKSTIQNVTLPDEMPHTVAAECWRIVIFEVAHPNEGYDFKIDVKWLAGCVRVDSVFLPSLIANVQILLNISEIQVSFFVINDLDEKMVENYSVLPSPDEQLFLTMTCNDLNALFTDYDFGRIMKISGLSKARLLNFEYLMLQSFIDPFFAETVLCFDKESGYQFACIIKNFHLHMSPSFIHTLTVARNLWNDWRPGMESPGSITAPYIICNNMNHSVVLRQESTNIKSSLQLPPFTCHLFAWYNPMAPKNVALTITSGKKEFNSQPFSIKPVGCHAVTCSNSEGELCLLFVSVIKHSSVVRQVVIQGSLLIYNLTNCDMDLCVVSYGKEAKSKLTPAHAVTRTSFSKNQLLSVILPLQHKLSFKIRYGSNANDPEQGQWSGLIPLMSLEKPCNQTSWMVKIPLKNHKEHFQSFWCQLTWEVIEEMPKYLVVFRPLCSVTSFLPWKIHVKIFNELGSVVHASTVSDKGTSTDLFIPDTVSLNNYAIECTMSENDDKCLSRKKFPSCERRKSTPKELRIPSLVDEIVGTAQNSHWPFLNIDATRIQWKMNQVHEINPIIKIKREEENGCGTKIEIFPWALIVNTFSCSVLWNISDTMYSVDFYEIISPPCIEGTFKLGLVDNGQNFLSGTLQLADDQSFPIPKVTGRIPMNGFVTTMIDCGDYVSYLNITSKSYEETRIINTCSSYVINNNSNINISYSAWVVCRTGDKSFTSFDMPTQLQEKSVNLVANESSTIGQSISKWHKIGTGDIQILPYLILSVDGNAACPVRICDLSEKQRYPIIFSSSAHFRGEKLPCIFITAQQCEGQVFLTIWEEISTLITIHNTSQLSLNVISSKSVKGVDGISYLPDWNWKFCVARDSFAHFHVNKQFSETNKKDSIFLLFSVESSKSLKQMKWSYGVQLKPCRNQLVTLPLSQRHIKLTIFKDGFTYVVWIKSATADEVSAKMIRNRLSESFLPVSSSVIPVSTFQEDTNNPVENDEDVPEALVRTYNKEMIKIRKTNIFVDEFTCTIACEDEASLEENDLVSFNAKKLFLNFSSLQKQNEVTEDTVCKISIESYQILNEEYHLRTFDFPVILLCKPLTNESDYKNFILENLFSGTHDREDVALNIKIAFKVQRSFKFDIRDIELFISSLNGYLEDKYILKLRSAFENIFSATMESSALIQKLHRSSSTSDPPVFKKISISTSRSQNYDVPLDVPPAKAKSSSSKSVNVSECGTDYSFKSLAIAESQAQNDDDLLRPTPDNSNESNASAAGALATPRLNSNCFVIPQSIVERSKRIAKPLRLRNICISSFAVTVSVRTSTTFYIAVDRSPLKFSEFKKEFLVTTPFELGNMLVVHYFMGAVYGTGWAISSLEFVGSPGVLARDLGTGIKDFVSMPLYGIATGPRGFVLGVAHGSASLMKHVMTGTLSSVTNFAGSWARTLNRFTLDADDLLQAEQIRRVPPSNIAEGILQGLSEFGISLLGGISGIAHHPLQYAVSNSSNRSLLNSISLGIVGVLTRPISGAAELVAKTGQGILSHVGWNLIPATPSNATKFEHFSTMQICDLRFHWSPEFVGVVFTGEAVDARNLSQSLWVLVTATTLHVVDAASDEERCRFDFMSYEFKSCEQDPTLIVVERPLINARNAVDFSKARIYRFINDTNRSLNIDSFHLKENMMYLERSETIFSFCVNPRLKNSLLNFIRFLKNMQD